MDGEVYTMTKLSTVKARDQFSDVINRAAFGKERVVLTRRGKDLVAVVPMEDIELLQALEDRLDLDAVRKALKERGTIPWSKVKADLGL
ncbi:MAG: type II toxin-antitoxin system Phd/YefM family antitoxin [Nitrospiria bacterium]